MYNLIWTFFRFNLGWISSISSSHYWSVWMVESQPRKMYILMDGLCFSESSCCIVPPKKIDRRKNVLCSHCGLKYSQTSLYGHPLKNTDTSFKSSRLPAKIAAYLFSIGWLLCLAFLYRWRFLTKIFLKSPLTLTTQPSTSKLSDNPAWYYGQFYSSLGKALTFSLNSTLLIQTSVNADNGYLLFVVYRSRQDSAGDVCITVSWWY